MNILHFQKNTQLTTLKADLASAQKKIQQLSTDESKHDSGLDPDMSTSSVIELESRSQTNRVSRDSKSLKKDDDIKTKEEIPQTYQSTPKSPNEVEQAKEKKKKKNLLQRLGLQKSPVRDGLRDNEAPPVCSEYEWRLNAYLTGSSQSVSPVLAGHAIPRLDELRQRTPSVSSRRSSCRGRYKRRSIAGSIVESFGLRHNEDNMSYISGFLSCSSCHRCQAPVAAAGHSYGHSNSVFYDDQDDFDDDLESSRVAIGVRCSSCDSTAPLHSDQFYPMNASCCTADNAHSSAENQRRRRRRRRSWRRSQHTPGSAVDQRGLAVVTRSLSFNVQHVDTQHSGINPALDDLGLSTTMIEEGTFV